MNIRCAAASDAEQVLSLVNRLLEEFGGTPFSLEATRTTFDRLLEPLSSEQMNQPEPIL